MVKRALDLTRTSSPVSGLHRPQDRPLHFAVRHTTMASPIPYSVDDKELDDAALWAVIDSAAASHPSSKSRKPLAIKHSNSPFPIPNFNPSPPSKPSKNPRNHHNSYSSEHDSRVLTEGEVLQEPWKHNHHNHRPQKIARYCVSEMSENSPPPPLAMVKHVQRTPTTPVYSSPSPQGYSVSSPGSGMFCVNEQSSITHSEGMNRLQNDGKVDSLRHSLSGQFPTVSLFKEYQNAAMAILEKGDFTVISGSPFIKKSGWRKISFYFNLSYEIKDKTIEFDDNRNVQRAEFVVRAYMQGGRFSDGWGSCERREKRFLKPNHDIPSTAETRAKNKACQDLLGIGEYRPGASQVQR